jgi:hypothetical protein
MNPATPSRQTRSLFGHCGRFKRPSMACGLLLLLALASSADAPPLINGHSIDPKTYSLLVEHRFLPTRSSFLSNTDIAQKLDLSRPELAQVKTALAGNNSLALEKGLIDYLNGKLPPLKPASPPKPAPGHDSSEMRSRPDAWLGKEMIFNVNGQLKTYEIGERINWFQIGDGLPDFAGWSTWGNVLAEAYLATGDVKYAQGLLMYARAFYRDCRPPAQRTTSWSGILGPWAVGGRGRAMGLLQWIYQVIAAAPVTTNADRLMFLKMLYEHGECMYLFSEEHNVTNFEFYPISVLGTLARQFPEFNDSKAWRQRATERVLQNMDDAVLDDGGAQERSQYNGSYLVSYTEAYRTLLGDRAAGPRFRQKLESMYEWFMWTLSPLGQYPSLNIGSLTDMSSYVEPATELFPERSDLVFFGSKGNRGTPPSGTAKVLSHTGFLTMRSGWSREALYMAMNYNGTLPEIPGTYPDLLSFGIWAHGRAYMTNAGTPVSYAHPLLGSWCTQTKASNTVMVDESSQHPVANGGRLENWQDRTGFTYLVAVSENYRDLGVRHRRAVLFLRPDRWLVFDRLVPFDQLGKVHDYRWQGHFQPMDLTVDPTTKTVATSAVDGKRLYLVPAQPEVLELERGKGLIADGSHLMENALEGPYVRFIQKSDKGASFTVLIDPTTGNAPAPSVTTLKIRKREEGVPTDTATGIRIRRGGHEDVVAMSDGTGVRIYGPLVTDGEAAYVRTKWGNVTEVGLAGGRSVVFEGQTLLEVDSEIASVSLKYARDKLFVDARGHGRVSVATRSSKALNLNGRDLTPVSRSEKNRWTVIVPSAGPLELESPTLSTDATAVYKALVGFRPGPALPPWNPVVVSWRTPAPSDATVDYAKDGDSTWMRTTKPDPVTDHRIVLNRLTVGTTYQLRIRSTTEDGRVGTASLTHTPEVAR